ncbi:MAG: hypothetical protein II852_11810 [Bacteroidales bacterium]|nr:hypothetical protein [Bacteroidales bacterium]
MRIDGIDHAKPSNILTACRPSNGIGRQAANSFCRNRSADITPTLATLIRILSPDYSSGEKIYEAIDDK